MMPGICYIALILGVFYCIGVAVIVTSLGNGIRAFNGSQPFVTVVVAARNEENAIEECLRSLVTQDYPSELFEIIVVDDRSTDRTAGIVTGMTGTTRQIRLLKIDSVPRGVSPKKNAVSFGIKHARGEIIMQTDADCVISSGWISGMVRRFGPDTGVVIGIAPYFPSKGILNSFVRHEYLWNAGLMAGSNALGMPTHASARNLAYRKKLFDDVGGYGEDMSVSSGDDTLFVQRIKRLTDAGITLCCTKEAFVFTRTPATLKAFGRQRIRHMSTGIRFRLPHIITAAAIYGFHLSFFVLAAMLFVSPGYLVCLAILLIAKLLADGVAGSRISGVCGLTVQWGRFVGNELLLIAYMAFMPIAGLLLPVIWKENDCTTAKF